MNKPEHNNKQLDPDYIKKEQEKTMKEWFGNDGYEALDKMVKQRKGLQQKGFLESYIV